MSTAGKKRSNKRASSPSGSTQTGKKKKTQQSAIDGVQSLAGFTLPAELLPDLQNVDSNAPSPAMSTADSETGQTASNQKQFSFKDPNFTHLKKVSEEKKRRNMRVWKNLKQIAQAERSLPWQGDVALYNNIEAPPSFKPAKKYSDLSGLTASYRDPQTKLRYSNTEEYARVRLLPSDIVAGLLALRKASATVP